MARESDRRFLARLKNADLEALLRLQAENEGMLWMKIAIDRAIMRHLFGA